MAGNWGIDPTLLRALGGIGPHMLAEVAQALASGRRRSIAEDARRVARLINPPPRVENLHLVPPRDPFLLVANHFQAPGIWIGLVAAAITGAVAEARAPERRELHWLVTSEWRWFEIRGRWVPNPLTSLLFPRACRVWGMVPTPPRPSDVAGRARALRQILAYLGRRPRPSRLGEGSSVPPSEPEPVGLFPEGEATVALREARPGVGAFLHRISNLGVPLLPVGVHQENGALVIRFGHPFSLQSKPPQGEELDGWARREVMVGIARLLPPELRGEYASATGQTE